MWVPSRDIQEKPYVRFDSSRQYRSRSLGECGCRVRTSRRSHMQGLMVVGFIVDEISRVGFKNDKVTRA